MGPFATAVVAGCLSASRWLSWLIAALLLAVVVVQTARGDDQARPAALLALAAGAAATGWVCGLLARRVLASRG